MSASLVGSEMCIRDSPGPRLAALPGVVSGRRLPPELGDLLSFPRGAPVSYTHLTLPTICSV
eukprot:4606120-Alexandrium_andersonii.AAC.1